MRFINLIVDAMFERQSLFETITVFRYKPLKNPGKKFIRGGWGGGQISSWTPYTYTSTHLVQDLAVDTTCLLSYCDVVRFYNLHLRTSNEFKRGMPFCILLRYILTHEMTIISVRGNERITEIHK